VPHRLNQYSNKHPGLFQKHLKKYSWIKDFIEDYWPVEAQKEFMIRYNVKKLKEE